MTRFRHIQTGRPLPGIPARQWNTMSDCAKEWVMQRKGVNGPSREKGSSKVEQTWLLLKNDTEATVGWHGVMGLDGFLITPSANQNEFLNKPMATGVAPVAGTHEGNFAVTLAPIGPGKIAKAVVAGVVAVQVDVQDEAHVWADIADDDTTQLVSGESGSARILFKESGTGTKWAMVRLGASPGTIELDVQITGATAIDGHNNRWSYTGKQVVGLPAGLVKDKTDGWTGTLYNNFEAFNDASGVQGSGDNVDNFPAGITLQPIGTGAVVRAWPSPVCDAETGEITGTEMRFAHPNNPGGACTGGE